MIKRQVVITIAISFCFCASSMAKRASAADNGLSFQTYMSRLKSSMELSSYNELYQAASVVNEYAKRASYEYSPWSISTTNEFRAYESIDVDRDKFSNKTTLKYESPSKMNVSLVTKVADGGEDFTEVDSQPLIARLSLGYDVLKGGRRSVNNLERIETRIDKDKELIENESRYFNEGESLLILGIQLYTTLCKLKDYSKLQRGISDVVKAAQVQNATNETSTKDYLGLVNLQNRFLKKRRNIESSRADLLYQMSSYSREAFDFSRRISYKTVNCATVQERDVQRLLNRKEEYSTSAQSTFTGLTIENSILKQNLAVEKYKVQSKASLTPYLSTRYTLRDETSSVDSGVDVAVGFTFTYEFKSDEYEYNLRSSAERLRYLSIIKNKQMQDTQLQVRTILGDLSKQKTIIPIVLRSVNASAKLLKILKTEQSVGLVDLTAFGNAYLDYIENLVAMRNIWESVETSKLYLENYRKVADLVSQREGQLRSTVKEVSFQSSKSAGKKSSSASDKK